MSNYKTYYLGSAAWAPKGRLVAYEKHLQIPPKTIEIEVVDAKALEACQKRLDEACELLQACLDHFEDPYTSPSPIIKIDTFLENIKDEGE